MKLPKRKLIFIFLTVVGIILAVYFIVLKNWFLAVIGALFSFVASYNIICKGK